MPSATYDPATNGPLAIVESLEVLCRDAETALCALDWKSLSKITSEQRRLTHALDQAFVEAPPAEPQRTAVLQRLRNIGACHSDQLSRLEIYHDDLGGRLKIISQWRSAASRMRNNDQRIASRIIDDAG